MKKRKSNKAPSVQGAVLAKRMTGESKSKIAKDLGIARNTVTAILSEAELSIMVDEGKAIIHRGIPRLSSAYIALGEKEFSRAESALERLGVIKPRTAADGLNINNFIGIGTLARPDARKPLLEQPKAT